jgi:DNA helicase-2/ATP-dependent DNA helicase PcrA
MRHHVKRLLPHLPQQVTADSPAVVARLKKHPAMLHALSEYVAAQAVEMRRQLASALDGPQHTAEQGRLLGAWDQTAERPLRSRCRAVRALVPTLLPPGLSTRIDDLLRRLSRRAQDIGRDWAELLTDSQKLWRSLGEPGFAEPLAVSRSDIAELVEYAKQQQEDVESLPEDVDPDRYQAVDGQPLDDDSPAGQLDREDHALLLRLHQLKLGGLPHTSGKGFVRYEHLALDEVQDLSAVEVKTLLDCVAQEGHPPSVTMAGDVVQKLIFDNGFTSWEDLLRTVELPGARVQRLHILYRSTVEVMELAQAVLGPLASDDTEQQAVRHGAPVQAFVFGEIGEAVAFLGEALRSLLGREPTASVALVARHASTAEAFYRGLSRSDVPSLRRIDHQEFSFAPGVDVTDVTQVKGLEFDYVVLLDATNLAYPEGVEARHLLHIAMTRAAHQLWLVATGAPSPLIPVSYFPAADSPGGAILD